jgi:SAM-dependent methyltransferase
MPRIPNLDAYWETRRTAVFADGLRRSLKRIRWINAAVSAVMSTRRGTDTYLLGLVRHLGLESILDVACGEGHAALATECETYGADIAGAPLDRAKLLGYREAFTYRGPDYRINLHKRVDAVTAIMVNAHVPFEILCAVLSEGAKHLKDQGYLILVAECDNDGASYAFLRKVNRSGFDALVAAMGHFFLEPEDDLLAKIKRAFPEFELYSRTPIVGSIVPYLQYRHALTRRDATTRVEQLGAFAFDALGGIANRVQLAGSDARGKSFLVGFVLKKRAALS